MGGHVRAKVRAIKIKINAFKLFSIVGGFRRARDVEAGNVSVRLHGKSNVGAKAKAEVIADILSAIKERRA
jgi:hypothetical protein